MFFWGVPHLHLPPHRFSRQMSRPCAPFENPSMVLLPPPVAASALHICASYSLTRWAPEVTSYKQGEITPFIPFYNTIYRGYNSIYNWSSNPHEWHYTKVTGVITLLITSRGPPCSKPLHAPPNAETIRK